MTTRSFRTLTARRMVLFGLIIALVLISGCVHMIIMETKPRLALQPNKALLVIVRPNVLYTGLVDNYLDGKMIGQTQGKSYFVTDVTPGTHYVMAHADSWATARMTFEANKVYFMNQLTSAKLGFPFVWTAFSVLTIQDAMQQINEAGCLYLVYDQKNPGKDIQPSKFEEMKADFEQEVKENSDRHSDTLGYKGYTIY
ncbi:MAG TPA: hypothetical protein VK445_04470 [Dissulfurispiraceae bacterium]|nr:hypothetical protein [Dissulfurispiraceae bacterium]